MFANAENELTVNLGPALQSFSSISLFTWLFIYGLISWAVGFKATRNFVKKSRLKKYRSDQAPLPLRAIGMFLSSPAWIIFYLLWVSLSWPNPDQNEAEKN